MSLSISGRGDKVVRGGSATGGNGGEEDDSFSYQAHEGTLVFAGRLTT